MDLTLSIIAGTIWTAVLPEPITAMFFPYSPRLILAKLLVYKEVSYFTHPKIKAFVPASAVQKLSLEGLQTRNRRPLPLVQQASSNHQHVG